MAESISQNIEFAQEADPSWIRLSVAPFLFRRNERTGKKGNTYFLPGAPLSRLLEELNGPPPMPDTYWRQFPWGKAPAPSHVASSKILKPADGVIFVDWTLEHYQFSRMYDAADLVRAERKTLDEIEASERKFNSAEERRLVEEYSQRLYLFWGHMWTEFLAAVRAGDCQLVGRFDEPHALRFRGVSIDALRRYKIVDWRQGDARSIDGHMIYSIYAVPLTSGQPADPEDVPEVEGQSASGSVNALEDDPLSTTAPVRSKRKTKALMTLMQDFYQGQVPDKPAEAIADDIWPEYDKRPDLAKPNSYDALVKLVQRLPHQPRIGV